MPERCSQSTIRNPNHNHQSAITIGNPQSQSAIANQKIRSHQSAIRNRTVPLLTLDSVSLAFGHVPLFESADLRIEPAERIPLIGRNGSGKSSLLRVISGETPPDAGSIWRAPSLRTARLEQDVLAYSTNRGVPSDSGTATVFDEVASGLGTLSDLVTAYHRAAVRVAERGDED